MAVNFVGDTRRGGLLRDRVSQRASAGRRPEGHAARPRRRAGHGAAANSGGRPRGAVGLEQKGAAVRGQARKTCAERCQRRLRGKRGRRTALGPARLRFVFHRRAHDAR